MKSYSYQITDIVSGEHYTCLHEPEGWDAYGVTYGRETGISNVVKGYVSQWTFVKEDARWLKSKLFTGGTNRRLRLRVVNTANLSSTPILVYEGDIDLTQAEWDSVKFTAPTSEGGFFKALENKWDETFDVNFDSYLKLSGATFGEDCEINGLECANLLVEYQRGVYQQVHDCLYFFHHLEMRTESEMNDYFLNDVNLQWFQPYIHGSSVSVIGSYISKVEKGSAFFSCQRRYLDKLHLTFDISLSCVVSYLDAANNHDYNCCHSLELYGVRRDLFNGDAYIRAATDGNIGDTAGSVQFYRQLATCNETAKTYKSDGVQKCKYSLNFSSGDNGIEFDDIDLHYGNGMLFFLVVRLDHGVKVGNNTHAFSGKGSTIDVQVCKNEMNVSYKLQLNKDVTIAAVPAATVFKSLIENISGGRYNVTTDTTAFEAVAAGDLLTAGEGMRNKPNPARVFNLHGKLTTSLAEFLKYAYAVYGYQLGVNRNGNTYTVYLAHFTELYEKNTVIKKVEHFNELKCSVNRDMLYSSIRIGYDTDNDIFDGVNEYNCIQVWQTPNTEIEGNELDLTSPYNASSKAVETFLFKYWPEWGDTNREETDIYLIHGELSGTYPPNPTSNSTVIPGNLYTLDRHIKAIAGVDYPGTQWNLKYTPKRMITAHSLELNSYFAMDAGQRITLLTCNLNKSLVSYDGTPPAGWQLTPVTPGTIVPTEHHGFHFPAGSIIEATDITIGTEHRFVPMTAEFIAIAGKDWIERIETARLGVIVLDLGDRTIRGYIAAGDSSVTINPIKTSASEFTILLTDIPTDL